MIPNDSFFELTLIVAKSREDRQQAMSDPLSSSHKLLHDYLHLK
jgi:hypothetical protein